MLGENFNMKSDLPLKEKILKANMSHAAEDFQELKDCKLGFVLFTTPSELSTTSGIELTFYFSIFLIDSLSYLSRLFF